MRTVTMFPFGFPSLRACHYGLAVVLLLLIPLHDTRPIEAPAEYGKALQLFRNGSLEKSQQRAKLGYERFKGLDPEWASKFQLLEAESMLWRGMYEAALEVLSVEFPKRSSPDAEVGKLAIEGVAYTRLQQFSSANQCLAKAELLCSGAAYITCGSVPRARGILAMEHGQLAEARESFLESLSFAQTHRDRWLEATALANLSVVSMQSDHFDEAIEWSQSAYRAGVALGAEDLAQNALGNLGWAYFELGDADRALGLFLDAEKRALKLGDTKDEIKWLTTAGYVYQDAGDKVRAVQSYRQALAVAQQINSKEDVVNALEDLAHVSIEAGKLEDATLFIEQLSPLLLASGNRLDVLDVLLAQGKIAAIRRQDQQAEAIFRAVEKDPDSQTSMRLGSEHELARLFEREGNKSAADRMYRTALTTFESARAQLKNEDSKLPFVANATGIYDDYIEFLVQQGRPEEALVAADQSRARTLAQGLGLIQNNQAFRAASLSPRAVARKAGATLLFYWLGERQSYLWAITPDRIALFPLPPQKELSPIIERYRVTLLDPQDTARSANGDGSALYRLLITPALKLIRPNTPVMILSDGVLSRMNFETLLVPGPSPITEPGSKTAANPDPSPSAHYWIDDAIVLSAPSLAMLAAAKPAQGEDRSLLLLGNPVSQSQEFPALPYFGFEMTQVSKHFAADRQAVFTGQKANPAAYLTSDPASYSYIHFVTHAVASRADPLDSAIILSGDPTSKNSFKLYARDIMRHPIRARLVTISACYGSGTRAYAGEGLVGLAWAFLRAGAHNTIGALWEVSDESTSRLMDALYQGIEEGQTPAVALRRGKLDLLHSKTRFRSPFYWAPFQIYTR